jgi:3-methyladenine DNA glycosylase AlkD
MTATRLTFDEIMAELRKLANPAIAQRHERFGSFAAQKLGIRVPDLRALAKGNRSRALAQQLWQTGFHEARILATMVDDPKQITRQQMDAWIQDFDSWDICDQACCNLFEPSPFALDCALEWPHLQPEYQRRAGFALMAYLAIHRKKLPDEAFEPYLALIEQYASDERNFVKKAVNWALRQIGKRNKNLCQCAIQTAERIALQDSPTARWVAADALRELRAHSESRP